jgi:asparagine synthase (glutamine-hydrolysing)
MCGIATIIDLDASTQSSESRSRVHQREHELLAILERIRHRGDRECFGERWVDVGVAMGTNRLAIVDREHARQPQSDQDGQVYVAYNGELYGFLELRRELERLGHVFRNASDTEVIVHAYLEWGPAMLDRLNGMFAFVLYDKRRNVFLAARDHVGIKPLYYQKNGEIFRFASEQKCLLQYPNEIHTLPPGTYMRNGDLARYISFDEEPRPISDGRAVHRYRVLFDEAVRGQVDTDLPIAVTFSGGIDSAAVLATARRYHPSVTAITIGFEGAADVEVATRYCQENGIPQVVSYLDRSELIDIIPEIVYGAEFFEAIDVMDTCVGYFAFKVAKEHDFKLALCGEGSDEVMAGYDLFKTHPDPVDLVQYRVHNLHRTDLQRVDRSSMMNSVETRVPFMDRHLLEFSYNLPIHLKLRNGVEKWLLREAVRDRLPGYIVNRPKVRMPDGTGMKNTLAEYASQGADINEVADDLGIDTPQGVFFLKIYLEAGFPMPKERFKRVGYDYSPDGYFQFVS